MGYKDIFVDREPAAVPESAGLQNFESYTPDQVARAIGASSVGSSAEMPVGSDDGDMADLNAKMDELWN